MLNVLLNLVLFVIKYIGGKISHSVSVVSDAFNNLTDAITTLFAWLGLKVSSVGKGDNHPNGHGRFEWIVALVASTSVILVGWELLTSSISAIKHPEETVFGIFTIIALLLSIGVKFFMFLFNKNKSKLNNSASLKAVSIDCLSDAISTTVVLISLLVNYFFQINIDGWCGILVSLFIIYNGFTSFKDTSTRIMGKGASKEQVEEIKKFALENSDFEDITDLQIEDYGYGRFRTSMTAIAKSGISEKKLLEDVSDLKYKLYHKYGYNIQIVPLVLIPEQGEITKMIKDKLATMDIPLTINSIRITNAGEYLLVEPQIGFDFMDIYKKKDLEQNIKQLFVDMDSKIKVIPNVKLKASDHHERYQHFHEREKKNKEKKNKR